MTFKNACIISLSTVLFLQTTILWYYNYVTINNQTHAHIEVKPEDNGIIEILIYNYSPGWMNYHMLDHCPSNCRFVKRDQTHNMSKYAYIIFIGPTLQSIPKKITGQTWIYYSREPPSLTPRVRKSTNMFNWTMTYRRDADIIIPYPKFKIRRNKTEKFTNLINETIWFRKKTSVWFVSNCKTQSKREIFVDNFNHTINVDIFGRCGTRLNHCGRNTVIQICVREIVRKYKFALTFENALCRDYVTEKVFRLYDNTLDTIPIVRSYPLTIGQILPPGTFIDSKEFKSLINMSVSKANTYFQNQHLYEQDYSTSCDLCDIVRKRTKNYTYKRNLYDKLNVWIYGDALSPICIQPNDLDGNNK